MSKPSGSIKNIKTPDNTSHEIIPDRLGNGSYVAGLPTLNKDSTLALEEDAIQLLSSGSVRITNLETGIYRLPRGTSTIYYNGTTSTDSISIGSSKSTILLFVNKSDASALNVIVQKWLWHIEYTYQAQNSIIYLGEVNYVNNEGVVNTNTGSYKTLTYAEFGYLSGLTSNVQTQLNGKQPTLVSGTNIKTINGSSVLGSGNIAISGTPTTVKVDGTSITSNNEANLKTMNGNYNANTNKFATASDLPTIDSSLSTTSENPVQNKVITSALNNKVPFGDFSSYTDVTMTASGFNLSYTATQDCWFYFSCTGTSNNDYGYAKIDGNTVGSFFLVYSFITASFCFPLKKGQTFRVESTNTMTNVVSRIFGLK